jgi:predicted amidohydrolase
MRVAAVQLTATADPAANRARAAGLVDDAVSAGATLVVLPEMFACTGSRAELRAGAEPLDGPTSAWAAAVARDAGVTLVAGSFIEVDDAGRLHNTSCVYGPDGARLAVYRKVHLFDVDVPGAEYRESDLITPGDQLVTVDVPVTGAPGDGATIRLGLSVCYDLRFPELYRILTLAGAEVVVVPAAFTATTGPPHWELLLRARAVENQVFVIAADQWGASSDRLRWHGHSMVVDPWGIVLATATATDGDAVVMADLDRDGQARVRATLPSVANRRPGAYAWPD